MLKEFFHISHVDFKHLHTLQVKSFELYLVFCVARVFKPKVKVQGALTTSRRYNKKSLSRMGLFSAKGLSRVCRRMEHLEEPSIATVTAMNAIHLQQLSDAHLKAPREEKEHNKFLSNPSLSSMQALKTLFIMFLPACPSVLLGFYVSFFLHIQL